MNLPEKAATSCNKTVCPNLECRLSKRLKRRLQHRETRPIVVGAVDFEQALNNIARQANLAWRPLTA
jgi:hypothetical protein